MVWFPLQVTWEPQKVLSTGGMGHDLYYKKASCEARPEIGGGDGATAFQVSCGGSGPGKAGPSGSAETNLTPPSDDLTSG